VIVLEVCVWGFAAFAVAFALTAAQAYELEGERLVTRTLGEASAPAGGEGVLIVDRAGVVVHASAAAQTLLGRSLLSLVGGRVRELLERVEGVYVTSRPLPGAVAHAFKGSSTAAQSALGEVLFLSADASSPVLDRYRALVGALSEGWLAVESFTGRILAANASAAGLFSLSEAELLEREFWTLAVPGEGGALRTRLVEAVGTTAGRFESGLERRGGIRFEAQLVVSEIDWDGTAAWQVLVADKSAEKRGERLETSGALAAGMAHDLKNVLQTILTATGSSALSAPESRVIAAAARKGDRMVRQILSGARFDGKGGAGQAAEPVALAQLVSFVVAEARTHFGDALELSLDFTSTAAVTAEKLEVLGDAHQLEQALTNLLLNARDAVGGRGRIAVELACLDEGALIAVDDDGPGLSEGERDRVFAPYYTTKDGGAQPVSAIAMQDVAQDMAQDAAQGIAQGDAGRGTGLGLPMVRAIVENHGGAVRVGAGTLGGARFELLLPLYKPRKAVLIIDPDEGFRFEAGRALKLSGWEVHTAATPERGLELARHHAEWLEVVLLDLVQNGMGGRACLEAVTGAAPKAKVVVASSVTSEATLKGAVAAGALHALAKPLEPSELVAVLSALG
jgi:signal transduction histidine kinase